MFNPRTADSIIQATESLGVKAPALVLKAQARLKKYHEITEGFVVHPDALVDAAQAAIDDDRDPASDAVVQGLIAGQSLGNVEFSHRLTTRAVDDYARIMSTHADTFVEAWSAVFDKAAADLTAAVPLIGDLPLSEAEVILARGGEAADAWSKANRANQVIKDIVGLWTQLNMVTDFCRYDRNRQVMRFTDPTAEQYYSNTLHDRKLSPWEAAQMRLTLSLANGAEYMSRIARLEQQEAAEIARQRDSQSGRLTDRDKLFMTANMR